MLTTTVVIIIGLTLLGLCFGSFAGATVWRLRARQLVADKKSGEEVDAKEYKQLHSLAKTSLSRDRSHCLHCGYELKWYDLVPLVSWLQLKGRCRDCKKPIGTFEPIIEAGMAAFFLLSYFFWPYELQTNLQIMHFIVWLVAGVGLAIAFAYDTKWFLLPDKVTLFVAVCGVVIVGLLIAQSADVVATVLSALASVGILSGLYLAFYLVSRGEWVGFGDVKLGLGLGLLLADWRLALIALFAANLIGSLLVIPGLLSGKLKSKTRIPFGPLLILGMVVGQLAGMTLMTMYLDTLL